MQLILKGSHVINHGWQPVVSEAKATPTTKWLNKIFCALKLCMKLFNHAPGVFEWQAKCNAME